MAISKLILNGVTQMDVTGNTVTAATLFSPKIATGADGETVVGIAVEKTLTTKSITANGTYAASSDNADGYSSVTVNVSGGGGASNAVTGTFKGTTAGEIEIALPYTGSGYPVAVSIFLENGFRDSTFYSTIMRYAVAQILLVKEHLTLSPYYDGNNHSDEDNMTICEMYKSSTSNAASVSSTYTTGAYVYSAQAASAGSSKLVRIKSATSMGVYIMGSSYGFMPNVTYRYVVTYSS